MICPDVNVLVYAHRRDTAQHHEYRLVLEELANGEELLGIADAVLSGFVRVVTNRRVFAQPSSPAEAWSAVERLIGAPAVMLVGPGERHWETFRRLADSIDAAGNDVPDAYLAAYAVERGATWLSADRGFARFPELRWRHPLDR